MTTGRFMITSHRSDVTAGKSMAMSTPITAMVGMWKMLLKNPSNAGFRQPGHHVPKGRSKTHHTRSAVPLGLGTPSASLPALRFRAIINLSLRDCPELPSRLIKNCDTVISAVA